MKTLGRILYVGEVVAVFAILGVSVIQAFMGMKPILLQGGAMGGVIVFLLHLRSKDKKNKKLEAGRETIQMLDRAFSGDNVGPDATRPRTASPPDRGRKNPET